MDPGHCASPGCYFRSINYKASSRQMAALVELSVECSQSIKVSYPIENKDMILGCGNKCGNTQSNKTRSGSTGSSSWRFLLLILYSMYNIHFDDRYVACFNVMQYDCVSSPLERIGISYAWWNDRNGNPQYFWSGSNSRVHVCQCGIEKTCFENDVRCNCDSNAKLQLVDYGKFHFSKAAIEVVLFFQMYSPIHLQVLSQRRNCYQ